MTLCFSVDARAVTEVSPQNDTSARDDTVDSTRQRSGFVGFWKSLGWRFSRSSETNETEATATIPTESADQNDSSSSFQALDLEQGSSEIRNAPAASNRASSSNPVCLICLESLTQEDFVAGRAISLGCECRGDMALRHKDCAIKWAQVKDTGRGGIPTCELCKKPARNLPSLPARPAADPEEAMAEEIYVTDASNFAFAPSTADLVFDCIRVTWVAMIISILFFDASLGAALWTGFVAGFAYIIMLRVIYRHHFEAMRAYAEQHAAARQNVDPSGGQIPIHVV